MKKKSFILVIMKIINKKTKYILLSFTIPFILILFFLIVMGFKPFGKMDIFSYCKTERVASFYFELWDHIHQADGEFFFFSTRSGVGYDFSSVITLYLSNPLGMIYLLLPRESLFIFSTFLYAIELSLAGLSFFIFIKKHNELFNNVKLSKELLFGDTILIFFSSIYSIIPLFFHSNFNSSTVIIVAILPLVFLGLDKIIKCSNPLLYIVMMFFSIVLEMHISIFVFVFSLLYLFVLSFFSFKEIIKAEIYKIISDIIVVGLAFPVINNNLHSELFKNNYSLNIWEYFSQVGRYRNLFFIIGLGGILLLNHVVFSTWFEKLNKKIKKITYIGMFFVILVSCVISFEVSIENKKNVICYEDTLIARTDKLIDDISSQDEHARIFVYGKDSNITSPVINTILGFDYVLIPDSMVVPDTSLEFVREESNVAVYSFSGKGDFDKECAINASSAIFDSELKKEYPFEKMNDIATELTSVDDVFVRVDDDIKIGNDPDDPSSYSKYTISYSFEEEGDYYTNLQEIIHLGELKSGERVDLKYESPNALFRKQLDKRESVYLDEDVFKSFSERIEALKTPISVSSRNIEIEVTGNEDYLVVPFDISSVFVDKNGCSDFEELSFFDTRIACISGSGLNEEYIYKPTLIYNGMICTVVSLIVLVILFVIAEFVKKYKNLNETLFVKIYTRIVSLLYENRVFIYVIIINIIIYVSALIYSQCVPFGSDSFVNSDGYVISYPVLRGLIEDIKSNSLSIPDYSIGACWDGMTIVSVMVTFINPTRFILFFMDKNNSLLVYNLYYFVNFLLIGPSIIIYLVNRPCGRKMEKTELKLIPISLAYSLSSFVMVYFSFSEFLEFAYIIPIIVLALERLVYEKKCILYTLLLSFFMISSTYYAFLLCELLVLYFLTLEFQNIKSFIKCVVRFALCSIAAAGSAVFALIPFYLNTQNCGYNESDRNAVKTITYFSQSILSAIKDVDMTYNPVVVSNDWSRSNAYCGMVVFTIAPLFLIISSIPLKSRLKRYLFVVILYVAFGNQLLNFVLHGFHFQTLVPNRFACFYIFLLITIFYDIVLNYKEIFGSKGVVLFSVFSGAFLAALLYVNNYRAVNCMKTALFVIVYLLIVLIGYRTKEYYKYTKLILSILVLELILSLGNALDNRVSASVVSENAVFVMNNYAESYNGNDDIFLRSEILKYNNYNSGKMVGNNSVSLISSIVKGEQIELMDFFNAEHSVNNINYGVGNPLSNLFLNVKYYMSEGKGESEAIPEYFIQQDDVENVQLYNDPYVDKAGVILPKEFCCDSSAKVSGFEKQNEISRNLVGDNLYNVLEECTEIIETDSGIQVMVNIPKKDIGDVYAGDEEVVWYLGYVDGNDMYSFGFEYDKKMNEEEKRMIKVAILNEETLEKLSQYVKTHSLSDYYLDRDKNEIIAHYDSEKDGKLMLPIPAYKNWQVKIDGAATSFDNSAGGLTILVPAGKHEVTVKYIPESYLPYYIISLVSFIIFMVSMYIYNKKLKKQENVEESTNEEIVESVSE